MRRLKFSTGHVCCSNVLTLIVADSTVAILYCASQLHLLIRQLGCNCQVVTMLSRPGNYLVKTLLTK